MNYRNLFIEESLPEPLTKEELLKYIEQAKNGNKKAREKIIVHNIKLVLNRVIKKFINVEWDKEDLVSIGLIGLIKAVDTYDISKNCFSTYAVRCIDNEIILFLRKIKKYSKENSFIEIIENKDSSNLYISKIQSDNKTDLVSEYEKKELILELKKQLNSLNPKDRKIIKLYFGFYNDKQYTQTQISEIMGVSRSYISTIINKNLKNIKYSLINQNLIEEQTPSHKKLLKK